MVQSLAVFLLKEGHSDLGFVGFAQLWEPFSFLQAQLIASRFKPRQTNTWLRRSTQFCAW